MPTKQPESISAKILPGHPFFGLVQQAYRVFNYPKPTSTEVCVGCCMDARIEADLFGPAIEDLPLHYVQDWYSAAYDPNGIAKGTWAYLLPRILEILAAGEDVSNVGIEVSLNRFDTGNSQTWSTEEWKVLDGFQRMYLRQQIEASEHFLDDVICMFSLAGWSLDDLLEQIASTSDDLLARRLWRDWCGWVAADREDIWITAFWEGSDSQRVFEFYSSRTLYERMAALALADGTEAELAEMALAVSGVIEAHAG